MPPSCVFSAEWEGKRLLYAAEITGIESENLFGSKSENDGLNVLTSMLKLSLIQSIICSD